MRRFKALKTFESTETRSTYSEGLSYTIQDNNRMLEALAELWAVQGKIQFAHKDSDAQLEGKGVIQFPLWERVKISWGLLWP